MATKCARPGCTADAVPGYEVCSQQHLAELKQIRDQAAAAAAAPVPPPNAPQYGAPAPVAVPAPITGPYPPPVATYQPSPAPTGPYPPAATAVQPPPVVTYQPPPPTVQPPAPAVQPVASSQPPPVVAYQPPPPTVQPPAPAVQPVASVQPPPPPAVTFQPPPPTVKPATPVTTTAASLYATAKPGVCVKCKTAPKGGGDLCQACYAAEKCSNCPRLKVTGTTKCRSCHFPNVCVQCGVINKLDKTKGDLCRKCEQAARTGKCTKCGTSPPGRGRKWCQACYDKWKRRPVVAEPIDHSHPKFKEIEKLFLDRWLHKEKAPPVVDHVLRIYSPTLRYNYRGYQEIVAENMAKAGIPLLEPGRLGNTHRRFHGTTLACDLAKTRTPCTNPNCRVCSIIKDGFRPSGEKERFGPGVYLTNTTSKSHDYAKGSEQFQGGKRTVFICDTVVGRGYHAPQSTWANFPLPAGYDSILGDPGRASLNYDEVVLRNPVGAYPHYLVIYHQSQA